MSNGMKTLALLRREAALVLRDRGHVLGSWYAPSKATSDAGRFVQWAECRRCRMNVTIIQNPFPNEIEIAGQAVAMSCRECSDEESED